MQGLGGLALWYRRRDFLRQTPSSSRLYSTFSRGFVEGPISEYSSLFTIQLLAHFPSCDGSLSVHFRPRLVLELTRAHNLISTNLCTITTRTAFPSYGVRDFITLLDIAAHPDPIELEWSFDNLVSYPWPLWKEIGQHY